MPEKVLGDVQALLAAVRFGERDLLRLVDVYGLEEMKSYMADILDTTEALTRAEFSSLPQGEWNFVDHIDNDGIDPQSIDIHVNVKIDGDEVFVDFDGTSPQAKGSINPNFAYTKSNVYAVMKCLIDPAIQSNSGFFRPFNITAPEGCFVNPQHPAPVAARGLAGFRICHAMFGAMAQALPGRVPAAWGGGEIGLSFGGYHPNRKAWVYLEFNNDGPRGGGPSIDGADGLASPVLNMANTPIESIESDQPLLVERFGLVPDTGGAGEYRGGLGIVREFRLLAEEATFQLRSDRTNFRPWGVEGGKDGTPTQNTLNPGTPEEQELPGKHLMTLKKGDLYRVIQAGAGGYGNPLHRDPQAVHEDIQQEKLTPANTQRPRIRRSPRRLQATSTQWRLRPSGLRWRPTEIYSKHSQRGSRKMRAKMTGPNQLTLPDEVALALRGAEYVDVEVKDGRLILNPVGSKLRSRLVWDKLEEMGITEADVADAVAWARQSGKAQLRLVLDTNVLVSAFVFEWDSWFPSGLSVFLAQ